METFNLHLTGDMHAVTAAHNMLAAMLDKFTILRSVDDAPTGTRLRVRVADGAITTISEGADEAH